MSIPKTIGGQFLCQVEGKTNYSVRPIAGNMAIMAYDEVIYISKEQAMAFWGLHDDVRVPPVTVEQYGKCRNVIKALGGAYPKSCPGCGFGPCKTGTMGEYK